MRESTIYITADYQVKSVTITNGGALYVTIPTVTFTSVDSGYGATGIAQVTAGVVTGVKITNAGQGYQTAPLISFSYGAATAVAVLTTGKQYPLDTNKDVAVLTEEGFGFPPIEYISQRGPYQHGESLKAYFLKPRLIQLLIRRNSCNRNSYYASRFDLMDALRPNRLPSICPVQGVLRRVLTDGRKFDINVVVVEGPKFATANDVWDRFSYQEAIRFMAYDPVFYDPTPTTVTATFVDTHIVFGESPNTSSIFPIRFGQALATIVIPYQGTWLTYPTIKIYGPLNHFSISNTSTGKTISISYPIPVGTYIQMGLEYGRKYVQTNAGVNIMGYISGDIATFAIEPGSNIIVTDVDLYSITARVEITYYTRYLGI